MRELKLILIAGFGLLFIGCTGNKPSFDPGNKEIKTVDGKHYMVPVGGNCQ